MKSRAGSGRSMDFRQPDHLGPLALWKVNQRCNLRCEYCFSAKSDLSREHPVCGRYSPRHIAQGFDRTGLSWWIFMTGGEPFLYPDFVGLCRELTLKHFLTIYTNLSTTNALRFAEAIDPRRVPAVNASLHIIERERKQRLDQFIAYVLHFQKKGFEIHVDYVAYPPLFNRLERDWRMLTSRGIQHVRLQAFQGIYRSRLYPSAYSRQERDVFRSLSTDEREVDLIERTRSFFGQPCRGGQEFFYMNIGGDMRRCPSGSRSYGNFFAGRYRLDEWPRPCPYPLCLCQFLGPELAGGPRLSPNRIFAEMVREGIPLAFNRELLCRIARSVRYRFWGKL